MSHVHDALFFMVKNLYEEKKWREILKLNEFSNIPDANRILWVWPNEEDIRFIQDFIVRNGLKGVSSIGCGNGLLEWILQQATGLAVEGIEINEEWWKSRYAYPPFIDLKFPNFPLENPLNKDHALLFCYFNNGPAFTDYVKNYTGNGIIIIGPSYGNGKHTEPPPFNVKFPSLNWKLECYKEIKQTKDFIAFYIRSGEL
ncbi:uncharacterized protein LOC123308608 [Coccinella septempunctata]|uniref:uncharacterized protein LOC123308608 n=1 Tax=Coccinella septempunctata TaxID=41139 RepID=UPI001D067000|nr:uncharacterized protein LOC123308608 [Coccinella septempunctata]